MKKTILHITEVSSGGVLPVIVSLCNGCVDEYNVAFAYGVRPDTPSDIEDRFDNRVKLIKVSSFTREINLKHDIEAGRELLGIARWINPDIIHFHSSKAGYVGRIFLCGYKSRKFYTPHGYSFLKKDDSLLKRHIYRLAEKILIKTGALTLACGKSEFDHAKKIDDNAVCVDNGIDTERIDEIIAHIPEHRHTFTVYTAGRIGPQKNPQTFNRIAEAFPSIDFIWIGDGMESSLLTAPNIKITGFVTNDEVIRLAKNCDCYLSFSLWEGLPIALMEAMYMRKICVVSNVDGNAELINGRNGFLYDTFEQCVAIIKNIKNTFEKDNNGEIRNDETIMTNYGEEARKTIENHYTKKQMVRNYKMQIRGGASLIRVEPKPVVLQVAA